MVSWWNTQQKGLGFRVKSWYKIQENRGFHDLDHFTTPFRRLPNIPPNPPALPSRHFIKRKVLKKTRQVVTLTENNAAALGLSPKIIKMLDSHNFGFSLGLPGTVWISTTTHIVLS